MRYEIGSFYEYEELPKKNINAARLADFLCDRAVLLGSGRDAIEYAISDIESKKKVNKRVLLPAYTCDTVIIPFEAAGYDIAFFHIDKQLNILADEFYNLAENFRPDIILFHTYYGYDGFSEIRPKLEEYKNKGISVIEDMTQSLFLDMNGYGANYYVGSLRKWFPVADGGFCLPCNGTGQRKELLDCRLKENSIYVSTKTKAMELKRRYLDEGFDDKAEFLALNKRAEELLDKKTQIFGMSHEAMKYLGSADTDEILKIRTDNFEVLKRGIRNIEWLDNLMPENAVAPLYYAVCVKMKREYIQEEMKKKNVFLPVLWSIPKSAAVFLNDEEKYIYDNMLAIPCDHRYNENDMQYIINCMENIKVL